MTLRTVATFVVLVPLSILGCNSVPASAGAVPCDVEAVFQQNCQQCHGASPRFGAPMPLVSFSDLHAASAVDPSQRVYQRVSARIHAAQAPMPPPPNPGLGKADSTTLDAWIAAGAPPADAATKCGPGAGGPVSPASKLSCTPDVSLGPPAPIEIPADQDALFCYGVDVPFTAKRHVTAVAPRIDDDALLHHITLFLSDVSVPATPQHCNLNGNHGWRLMSIWTPGAQAIELPPQAGFPAEGTMHYVVQVHYENLQQKQGHQDRSGFDLCTTDVLRPNDAGMVVFGADQFTVPAHGSLDVACDYEIPPELAGRTMIDALPHMHRLGKRISATLLPKGIDLGSRSPWTYTNQYWTPIPPGAVTRVGDSVQVRCAWDNPGGTDVSYGEGAGDEMCSSFTIYYPEVPQPWASDFPLQRSHCH